MFSLFCHRLQIKFFPTQIKIFWGKKKLENTLSEFKVKKPYTKVAKIRAISVTFNNALTFDSEVVKNLEILCEYSYNIYKCIHGQILYLNELDKLSNLKAIVIKH